MRKVTEKTCRAFMNREKLTMSNTYTDGEALYLFNNKIAEHREDGVYICDGGYGLSMTTKERLGYFAQVYTRKGVDFLNGEQWDGDWTKVSVRSWY